MKRYGHEKQLKTCSFWKRANSTLDRVAPVVPARKRARSPRARARACARARARERVRVLESACAREGGGETAREREGARARACSARGRALLSCAPAGLRGCGRGAAVLRRAGKCIALHCLMTRGRVPITKQAVAPHVAYAALRSTARRPARLRTPPAPRAGENRACTHLPPFAHPPEAFGHDARRSQHDVRARRRRRGYYG